MRSRARIAVVGATGAVGRVAVRLLRERGHENLRLFASARSAGSKVDGLPVEEATPEALARGECDLAFFSVGTAASLELVPHALAGGARVIDKSDAYRLRDGVPLVVAGINDDVVGDEQLVANPNCSAIQLTSVLAPLHAAAGVARVRVATYQSMSGAGDAAIERLRSTPAAEADLAFDWELEGDELDEESKLREETRKILALPELPVHAACVRVPVLVGHAQTIWVETEEPLDPDAAREALAAAPNVALEHLPTPAVAAGRDEVLVARIRRDPTDERTLALWSVNDNLRKGAALNAVQIAERLLGRERVAA